MFVRWKLWETYCWSVKWGQDDRSPVTKTELKVVFGKRKKNNLALKNTNIARILNAVQISVMSSLLTLKQARKLQATLVRNYDSLTESLTDRGKV